MRSITTFGAMVAALRFQVGVTATADGDVTDGDDAFTVVFVSDIETNYRWYTSENAKQFVEKIATLGDHQFTFDSGQQIDPALVVHGGDIASHWDCANTDLNGMCPNEALSTAFPELFPPVALEDRPGWMLNNVFNQLYDRGIAFVSSFGNHDWTFVTDEHGYTPLHSVADPAGALLRNKLTATFVGDTYARSAALPGADFRFERVNPTLDYGPPMFTAEFRGLQLADFGFAASVRSFPRRCTTGLAAPCHPAEGADSSEQMAAVETRLDQSKPALFYHHAPLSAGYTSAAAEKVRRLIAKHPQAALLSGHQHSEFRRLREARSPATENSFYEYTAGYAHEGKFLALRVSPTRGVLEVKSLTVCLASHGVLGSTNGLQCKSGRCENGFCVPDSERKKACDTLADPDLKGKCEAGKCLAEHCKRGGQRKPERDSSCAISGLFGAERNHDVCQSGYCGPSFYCARLGMDVSDHIAVTPHRQVLVAAETSTTTKTSSTFTATTGTSTTATEPPTTVTSTSTAASEETTATSTTTTATGTTATATPVDATTHTPRATVTIASTTATETSTTVVMITTSTSTAAAAARPAVAGKGRSVAVAAMGGLLVLGAVAFVAFRRRRGRSGIGSATSITTTMTGGLPTDAVAVTIPKQAASTSSAGTGLQQPPQEKESTMLAELSEAKAMGYFTSAADARAALRLTSDV